MTDMPDLLCPLCHGPLWVRLQHVGTAYTVVGGIECADDDCPGVWDETGSAQT